MNKYFGSNLKSDLPSGLVVALVALPLCLGIALASGAPLFSGIVAAIAGGLIVGFFSDSQLSVSGPAAGLTVIVFNAIESLGAFDTFLLTVVIAGVIQLALGILKAGTIGHFFPSSVIKGMLSAIGLILILKQIPHALGDDQDYEGDASFWQPDGENTFTEIILALQNIEPGALIISIVALVILVLWERPFIKTQKWSRLLPGPLVAVAWGMIANTTLFELWGDELILTGKHLVNLPTSSSASEFFSHITFPDFSQITSFPVYSTAFTIAVVASLETLLSLDAVDKLDPMKRIASTNQELKAQGLGNMFSGMFGGLPVTAVIVRSTANISSGGQTKVSVIFHGLIIMVSALIFPQFLNKIPLSALAAVLIVVGFKLTKPTIYKKTFSMGWSQFLPFIITILAILFTDLLVGISIGMVVGVFFVIKSNLHESITLMEVGEKDYVITLQKDVSFLNKAVLRHTLMKIPADSHVVFDETDSIFIDHDIVETIEDFKARAKGDGITMEIRPAENTVNTNFGKV